MSHRVPPKFALWLLTQWGSTYHRESLAGDIVEQYQQGKSRAWCWGQVAAAIVIARARFIRAIPWARAGRVLSRWIAEAAAVLALAVLGAGTLTWAASAHRDACPTAVCIFPSN
jgi:hypothetical protein